MKPSDDKPPSFSWTEKLLLRAVEEHSGCVLLEHAEAGVIISANPQITKLTGYSKNELNGTRFNELITIFNGSDLNNVKLLRKDESEVFCRLRSKEVNVAGWRFILRFLESNESEHLIDKHCALWSHDIPEALFLVDMNMMIADWNRRAEELTGYSYKEVIGKRCTTFCPLNEKRQCTLFSYKVPKPIMGKEQNIKRKDGKSIPIIKNASLLRDNHGKIIGGVEVFNHVSSGLDCDIEKLIRLMDARDC